MLPNYSKTSYQLTILFAKNVRLWNCAVCLTFVAYANSISIATFTH